MSELIEQLNSKRERIEAAMEELRVKFNSEMQRLKDELKPQPLQSPDYTALKELCALYIDAVAKRGWPTDDDKRHIFEAAMEAIYGPDVFEWVRNQFEQGKI